MPYHAVCNKNMSIYSVAYAGRFIANHRCPMLNLYSCFYVSEIRIMAYSWNKSVMFFSV